MAGGVVGVNRVRARGAVRAVGIGIVTVGQTAERVVDVFGHVSGGVDVEPHVADNVVNSFIYPPQRIDGLHNAAEDIVLIATLVAQGIDCRDLIAHKVVDIPGDRAFERAVNAAGQLRIVVRPGKDSRPLLLTFFYFQIPGS